MTADEYLQQLTDRADKALDEIIAQGPSAGRTGPIDDLISFVRNEGVATRRFYQSLTFVLDEPVTPDHLASRVAGACGTRGALRPGEGILLPSDPQQSLLVRQ